MPIPAEPTAEPPAEPTAELTPLQYLACADREWATGHHRHAAALLWRATKSTFIALAHERGLDYDELFIDLAKALEADGSVRKGYYRDRLGVAKLMRDHAELDVLEGIRLESAYCVAREFIVELHSDRQ